MGSVSRLRAVILIAIGTSLSGCYQFSIGTKTTGFTSSGVNVPHLEFDTQLTTSVPACTALAPSIVVIDPVTHAALTTASNDPLTVQAYSDPGCTAPASPALAGGTGFSLANGRASLSGISFPGVTPTVYLGVRSTHYGSVCTGAITVAPGTPTQLAFTLQPSTAVASLTNLTTQVGMRDACGNASSIGLNITLSIASGTGTAGATLAGTVSQPPSSGLASFTVGLTTAGSAYQLVASAPGLTSATSSPFTIQTGAAAKLAVSTSPASSVAGQAFDTKIAVTDAFGNTITGSTAPIAMAITNNTGGGTLSGTTTVNAAAGVADFSTLSIDRSATGYGLTATSNGLQAAAYSITIAPDVASQMVLQPVTTPVAAGAAFPVQVTAEDKLGNPTPAFAQPFSVAITTNPSGATLQGTTSRTPVQGTATFSDLNITKAATGYVLTVSATGLPSKTFNLDVNPGNAFGLYVKSAPTTVQASQTFDAQIGAKDVYGNLVPTFATPVQLAIQTNTGGATLTGGGAKTPVSGIADFNALAMDRSGNGYVLQATATGLAAATFPLNVGSGPPASMMVTNQPSSSVPAGTPFAVQVTLYDAQGNLATSATGNATVALTVNPAGGTLSGTLTQPVTGGVATFGNLSINKAGVGNILTVSYTGIPSVVTQPIAIDPSAAASLVFTSTPVNGVVTKTLSETDVEVHDSLGNLVTNYSGNIALSIATGPSGAKLTGTTTIPVVAGVAAFTDLVVDTAGTYTWLASLSGTGVTAKSSAFTVIPLPNKNLAFVNTPSSVAVKAQFSAQVQVLDVNGNLTNSTDAITLTLTDNTVGASFTGGTVNAVNGTASFTGLQISAPGAFVISASCATCGAVPGTWPIVVYQPYVAVSAGDRHTCAIANGGVQCWGDNQFGEITGAGLGGPNPVQAIPANDGFTSVVANVIGRENTAVGTFAPLNSSTSHTCATNGTSIQCWGSNAACQLGKDPNTTPFSSSPVTVVTSVGPYSKLVAGAWHTCAVSGSASVSCWGFSGYGQVQPSPSPTPSPSASPSVSPSPVPSPDCPSAMGFREPIAVPLTEPSTGKPVAIVASLSSAFSHTCALSDKGTVFCWGFPFQWSYLHGWNVTTGPAALQGVPAGITQLATATGHTAALLSDGTVQYWLHLNSPTPTVSPLSLPLPTGRKAIAISAGGFVNSTNNYSYYTCALLDDLSLYCKGPELPADPTTDPGPFITPLISGSSVDFCAVRNTNQVSCVGDDSLGQLGY